jgi:hypothetical protein
MIVARPLPPPHVSVVDRPPRPLHARRMQPPPHASSRDVGPREKSVLSSSRNGRQALATPLCLSPRLCSLIAAPLSSLRHHTSRPTRYRPVSPASPPSRCSQPRGKSTTGTPAWAPRHPPSSTTANSSLTGRLRLIPPLRHLPEHHRDLGYLSDLSSLIDKRSSDPSREPYLPPSSPPPRAHTGEPPSVQNPKLGSPPCHLTLAPRLGLLIAGHRRNRRLSPLRQWGKSFPCFSRVGQAVGRARLSASVG